MKKELQDMTAELDDGGYNTLKVLSDFNAGRQ